MFPAARLNDMHMCPMVTPAPVPIPHVGGPIMGPGAATVLTGNMLQAQVGNVCTCVGPPDVIVKGSATVLAVNMPAARIMDACAHGGMVVMGFPTVIIGG